MTWENYLKSIDEKEINEWSEALKAFIKQGRELGIPLDVMSELENAKKAAGISTTKVVLLHLFIIFSMGLARNVKIIKQNVGVNNGRF